MILFLIDGPEYKRKRALLLKKDLSFSTPPLKAWTFLQHTFSTYIEDTLFRMWDSLWKYFWTVVSNLDLFAVGSLSIPKHKLNIRRYLGLFFCDYSKLAIAKSLKICLVFEGENWAKKGYVAQGVWTAKRSKVLSLEHYHCCIVSGNTLRKHVEKTSWCWLVVILWISSKMTDVVKSP